MPKSSSMRPVILRHSGVFCWLLYLWVLKKYISRDSGKMEQLHLPSHMSVHRSTDTPLKSITNSENCEQQMELTAWRGGGIYLTSSPSSSIDRQMVHFSSVSSSAPSSSSCLPCSFLCSWETFGNVTFDEQHQSSKVFSADSFIIRLIHSVLNIKQH